VESAIASLVAGRGGPEMTTLAMHAIRYVVVAKPDTVLARALDSAVGLRRLSTDGGGLWRSTVPDARALLVAVDDTAAVIAGTQVALPVTSSRATAPSIPGVAFSLEEVMAESPVLREALSLPDTALALLLAERDDDGWIARADGSILERGAGDAGTSLWLLPEDAQSIAVQRDTSSHSTALLVQLVLLLGVLLLALPSRVDDDPEGDAEREFLTGARV
jgi:hypothetical protein